jgi:DNA repair protein RadC
MLVTIDLTEEQLAALQVAESQRSYAKTSIVNDPKDVADYLAHLKRLKQEHSIVVTLNSRSRILRRHVISKGTLDAALVHPRDLFRVAIQDNAAKVILAHNHPSGDCAPSDDDIMVTKRMVTAGKIIGIPVVDHLIIATGGYYSLQEHGHL